MPVKAVQTLRLLSLGANVSYRQTYIQTFRSQLLCTVTRVSILLATDVSKHPQMEGSWVVKAHLLFLSDERSAFEKMRCRCGEFESHWVVISYT